MRYVLNGTNKRCTDKTKTKLNETTLITIHTNKTKHEYKV